VYFIPKILIQVFLKLKDLSWFLFLQLKWFLFNQIILFFCFFWFYFNLKNQAFQAWIFFSWARLSLLIFSARAFQAIIKNFGSSQSQAEPGLTPSLLKSWLRSLASFEFLTLTRPKIDSVLTRVNTSVSSLGQDWESQICLILVWLQRKRLSTYGRPVKSQQYGGYRCNGSFLVNSRAMAVCTFLDSTIFSRWGRS
jgi:hypothetical protein